MKRPVLFGLLGLSLAANAWFLLSAPSSRAPRAERGAASRATRDLPAPAGTKAAATAQTPPAATAPGGAAEAPVPARGLVWRTPATDEDYRQLAADLRAAGFPSRLIYRVLADMHLQQRLSESPLAKAPFWQHIAAGQSAEMQAFYREQHTRIADLLGPDGRPSARLNAVTRKRQYGSLSDAKIDAIASIERDYQEMQSDVYRSGGMVLSDFATIQKQAGLLSSEKLGDLTRILTPAELEEYQLHNSESSRRTATLVREVPLNAVEFAALVRAREAFDATQPVAGGSFTPEMLLQRQAAQAAYYEQMRAAVPDGRFHEILEHTDTGYRVLSGLRAQHPAVTPAVAYQALQLQNEMQQARAALLRNRPTPGAIQSAYATWNARLDQLLGPAAGAAYRKTTPGRAFIPPATGAPPPRS